MEEDEIRYRIEEHNRWMEEIEKNFIRDGYREAFNDDPEAEWNID